METGEETVQKAKTNKEQHGLLERLRTSAIGVVGRVGIVLGTLSAGDSASAEMKPNPIRVIFSSEWQQFQSGKLSAAEFSKRILAITDDQTGKDDEFLRKACEEALAVAAQGNDEPAVAAALAKMRILTSAAKPGTPLFSDPERRAAIETAAAGAAKAGHANLALALVDILESSKVMDAEAAWLKRAEICEQRPIPADHGAKLLDTRQQIELGSQALLDKRVAAGKRIAIDTEKLVQRLPVGEAAVLPRQETLQLSAVARAMEGIEKTGGTKMDHSTVGLFLLTRGKIQDAYAELREGGHVYVTRYPLGEEPEKMFETAHAIAKDLERARNMAFIEVNRLRNLCAYCAKAALAKNVLMNEKRVLAEKYASWSVAPVEAVRPVTQVAVATPPVNLPAPPQAVQPANNQPATRAVVLPEVPAASLDTVPHMTAFFAAQGCVVEFDTPNKKRVKLTGNNAVIPDGAKLYGITVPPQACTPTVIAGLANMKVKTRISMFDTPLNDAYATPLLSTIDKQVALDVRRSKITDAAVLAMKPETSITRLGLSQTATGDASLMHIAKNTAVTSLMMNETKVTNAGMAAFANTTHMQQFEIAGTQVTGAGVAHLSGSPLQTLNMSGTPITNADMPAIATLLNLESLDLSNTRVNFAGLKQLSPLGKLRNLTITGCPLSALEVQQLQQVLPACRIITR